MNMWRNQKVSDHFFLFNKKARGAESGAYGTLDLCGCA